jgi:hypothetical protein
MSNILQAALASRHEPSEQLTAAIEIMQQNWLTADKEKAIDELANKAPEHEQEHFADLFESLALGLD